MPSEAQMPGHQIHSLSFIPSHASNSCAWPYMHQPLGFLGRRHHRQVKGPGWVQAQFTWRHLPGVLGMYLPLLWAVSPRTTSSLSSGGLEPEFFILNWFLSHGTKLCPPSQPGFSKLGGSCSPPPLGRQPLWDPPHQCLQMAHLSASTGSAWPITMRLTRGLPYADSVLLCSAPLVLSSVAGTLLPLCPIPQRTCKSAILARGPFCSPGALPCLETFWLAQLPEGCNWQLVGGGRGCCLISYNAQDGPQDKGSSVQRSSAP